MGFFKDDAKTEKPTGKRLEEARSKGHIPRSQELTASVVLMCSILVIYIFSRQLFQTLCGLNRFIFSQGPLLDLDRDNILALLVNLGEKITISVFPIFLIALIVSVLINVIQTKGFYFNPGLLKFDLSRINPDPTRFFKRLYSPDTLVEFIKSILKIIILFSVFAFFLLKKKEEILSLIVFPFRYSLVFSFMSIFKIFVKLGVILVILGVLDFVYRKWKFMQDMMMTKEEVKEEMKQLEGDPKIKAKRRSKHVELLKNIIAKAVPKADVVITNPVHLAVALQYDSRTMRAPKVVAKGAGYLAERIKKIAREHGIMIIENPPLARTLYKNVEVGEEIPESLYKAVAEILAYVYRVKKKAV